MCCTAWGKWWSHQILTSFRTHKTIFENNMWTIFEINRPFVYIENVLDLCVQLVKNGGKNKSVVFIILFSEYVGLCMYVCMCVYTINDDILLFKSDSKDNVHNVAKYFYFNISFFIFYFFSLKNPDEIYNSPLIIWNVFELQIRIIGMISEVSWDTEDRNNGCWKFNYHKYW